MVDDLIAEAIDDGGSRSTLTRTPPDAEYCFTAIVTRKPRARRREASRCCNAFPARRSTCSTPAVAAWRARSASSASTTIYRFRSAGCDCSRRSPRRRPTRIVAATGVSCRQQIVQGTSRRRCIRWCSFATSCSPTQPHENLTMDQDHRQHARRAGRSHRRGRAAVPAITSKRWHVFIALLGPILLFALLPGHQSRVYSSRRSRQASDKPCRASPS